MTAAEAVRGGRPFVHWVLLFSLVVMWGSSFMFTKLAVSALPPTTVVTARLAIAVAVLAIAAAAMAVPPPRGGRLWRWCAVMAVIGNALPFWLISWGQQRIDSGLAGVLMAVMPLATIVLAHFFVAGERLTPMRGLGFGVGFVGIVVLVGPQAVLALAGSPSTIVAEIAVLGGALCYAVNAVIARRRPASAPLTAALGVSVVAATAMVPAAALLDHPWSLAVDPVPAAAVGFLGVVSTGVATVVYFALISAAGPSFLSLINYLIPVWAVVVGMLALGEPWSWRAFAALVLVLAGIGLAEVRGRPIRQTT